MIVSHKHKFIFIKTTKTAGTSVEIALSRHCGPDDIITPISGRDESIRQEWGGLGPQHHLLPFSAYGLDDYLALIRKKRRKLKYYNHMPASAIKPLLDPGIWQSYFKFCIERNPWDRVISFYFHATQNKTPRPGFAEFLETDEVLALHRGGFGCYILDGTVVVDKICRYESLADDLEEIRLQLGIPEKLELPMAKASIRTDKRNYREFYTPQQQERVATLFDKEITLLGYQF